jgi:hypothetical protein
MLSIYCLDGDARGAFDLLRDFVPVGRLSRFAFFQGKIYHKKHDKQMGLSWL